MLIRHHAPINYHASAANRILAIDPLLYDTFTSDPLLFDTFTSDPLLFDTYVTNPLLFDTYITNPLLFETDATDSFFFEPYPYDPPVKGFALDHTSHDHTTTHK